jgi:hypothetical protein
VTKLINLTKPVLQINKQVAERLLGESNRYLAPLQDPLKTDFGLHRWLDGEREESYSDWLGWIIEQLAIPERITKLLLNESTNESTKLVGQLKVHRESSLTVLEGKRRTDIEVIFGTQRAILIEVKLIDADEVDPEQLKDQADYRSGFAHYLLLALSGESPAVHTPFKLLLWRELCIRLRKMIPELCRDNLITAAMSLAFVGAVEQNLLGLPRSLKQQLEKGLSVNSTLLDYLLECPRREGP